MADSIASASTQGLDDLNELLSSMRSSDTGGVGDGLHPSARLSDDVIVETNFYENAPVDVTKGEQTLQSTPIVKFEKYATVNDKHYKIIVIKEQDLVERCFGFIGSGGSFCISKECEKAKHAKVKNIVSPGEGYVLKNLTVAFESPFVQFSLVDSALQKLWSTSTHTLQEWSDLFDASRSHTDDKFTIERLVDEDIVRAHQNEKRSKLEYKTPSKRQKSQGDEDQRLFLKLVKNQSIPALKDQAVLNPTSIINILHELENQIHTVAEAVSVAKKSAEQDTSDSHRFSEATEEKFALLFRMLGQKPKFLQQDLDAPSLWSVVGNVADICESFPTSDDFKQIQKQNQSFVTKFEQSISQLRYDLSQLESNVQTSTKQYQFANTEVLKLQHFKIISLNESIRKLQKNTSINNFGSQMDADVSEIIKEVKLLREEVKILKGNKDSKFVRYQNLGFSSFDDAQGWFGQHSTGNDFGHLVDFHTVLENVFNMITGQDLLTKMHTVFKIQLTDMSQASAVTSFETELPKFFLKSTTIKVFDIVDKSDSYFSGIQSWDDWDLPYEGMRAKLVKGTQRFRESHQRTLQEGISNKSPFLPLAKIALVDSCEWTYSLIQFIDQTYRDYEHAKFDKSRAWHITTRLATKLITKVYEPRIGINNRLSLGNTCEMGKVIFWASIKSLEIMTNIREVGFANEPSVSAELVKFLATHTEFDTIQKLSSQQDIMKNQMSTLVQDLKSLDKSDKTANNKVAETKDQLKDLKARLLKLEKKG